MASWDDEDFEPEAESKIGNNGTDKWEGEDEDDDDIKDNWDDEEETVEKKAVPVSQPKKKKPLAERIQEKQKLKQTQKLEKEKEMELFNESQELTPEEQLEERLRNQRLQEESDLELAKEAFGVTDVLPGQKTIDNLQPKTKEDFQELSHMIVQKFTNYEHRSEYPTFLENLFRDCCAGVDAEEIKKISNTLNILATEKLKLTKASKGGKKSKKNTSLVTGKGTKNELDYDDDYYNEYEDFM